MNLWLTLLNAVLILLSHWSHSRKLRSVTNKVTTIVQYGLKQVNRGNPVTPPYPPVGPRADKSGS